MTYFLRAPFLVGFMLLAPTDSLPKHSHQYAASAFRLQSSDAGSASAEQNVAESCDDLGISLDNFDHPEDGVTIHASCLTGKNTNTRVPSVIDLYGVDYDGDRLVQKISSDDESTFQKACPDIFIRNNDKGDKIAIIATCLSSDQGFEGAFLEIGNIVNRGGTLEYQNP